MAKVTIKAATGDIISVIPDHYEFGTKEVVGRGIWRVQVTDLTLEQIKTFTVGEWEKVNYYDGDPATAPYVGFAWLSYGTFNKWYFDFTDAPQHLTTLNAGDTLLVTSSQVRQQKLLRRKPDGHVITPADFNTPDHTPIRERDDDCRNFPGAPLPPELGGSQEMWSSFLAFLAEGYDPRGI